MKKTFAEQVSTDEMNKRLRGTAISGVNTPAPANAAPVARKEDLKAKEALNPPSARPLPLRSPAPSIHSDKWCAISTSEVAAFNAGFAGHHELFQAR